MPPDSISIKEYLDARITALRDVLEARFATIELRLSEFQSQVLKRLDNTNGNAESVLKRLESLEMFKSNLEGKFWAFGIVFTVVISLVQVGLSFLLK
mgnify:CR=1 FL=1